MFILLALIEINLSVIIIWFMCFLFKKHLTSSRREYYIFPGPPCGIIFSENREKFLAINNFFVNKTKSGQPNKRLFSLTFRELNG